MMNAFINCKTNSKKLSFGIDKCKKLHVGKTNMSFQCQDLKVQKWTVVAIQNNKADIFDGEEVMEKKDEEKYLGDAISSDGRNIKNVN